jgi:uncharacterized membrane protein HdeD (DUF308 family)
MKKEINKNLNIITIGSIILDVLFILLGIFLVINPELSIKVSGILIGLILIISGLYFIIEYVLNMDAIFLFTIVFIYGIISILGGILILSNPTAFTNFLTIIIGIWLLISAGLKASIAMQFKNNHEESWIINLVIAILTIVIAILMIANPFSGSIVISTYAGIMFVVYAGMDIVEQCLFRKRAGEIENIIFDRK